MKTMIHVCMLLLCICFSSSVEVAEIYRKYAATKLTEGCFGKEKLSAFTAKVYSKISECAYKSNPQPLPQSTPFFKTSKPVPNEKQENSLPTFDWSKLFSPESKGNFIPIAVPMSPEQAAYLFNPASAKVKREVQQAFYSEAKVRNLKGKVAENIKSFTCIMEGLKYVANGTVITENLKKEVRDFKLNKDLEADLLSAVDVCTAVSTSPSLSYISTTLSPELHQQSVFFKCVRNQRMRACLKNDLRKSTQSFDLTGLDGTLDQLSDSDQMLAIVWADIQLDPISFLDVTF